MSRIFMSRFFLTCIFMPRSMVPHFHVSYFHDLHFWWCRIFISRIFSRPFLEVRRLMLLSFLVVSNASSSFVVSHFSLTFLSISQTAPIPTDTPAVHNFHLASFSPPALSPILCWGQAQFVHARWLSEPATSGRHGDGHVTSAAEAAAAAASREWAGYRQWRFWHWLQGAQFTHISLSPLVFSILASRLTFVPILIVLQVICRCLLSYFYVSLVCCYCIMKKTFFVRSILLYPCVFKTANEWNQPWLFLTPMRSLQHFPNTL